MFQLLTFYHSIFRWLVLLSLVVAICIAWRGYRNNKSFSSFDNGIRHWTATIAHVQLIIGMILYFKSPAADYFWKNFSVAVKNMESLFFGFLHMELMLIAIAVITAGSALAKRRPTDKEKFRTMYTWFGLALIIIFCAIPWPFSPFAHRPYWR